MMKGKHCIQTFWEVGLSYSTDEKFYVLGLHWWNKGANFMTEIKYHVLRALLTSGQRHSNAKLLYDN